MSTKRNARSVIAVTGRAAGTAAFERAAISHLNLITVDGDRQSKIADLLCIGQENAVPLRDLCSMAGLDGRTVRRMIERERRAGIPICSDSEAGYFIAANNGEITRFVRQMRGRAREILTTAAAVEGYGMTVEED